MRYLYSKKVKKVKEDVYGYDCVGYCYNTCWGGCTNNCGDNCGGCTGCTGCSTSCGRYCSNNSERT